MGAEEGVWKHRRKQHKQEEARALMGVDYLGQTSRPARARDKQKKTKIKTFREAKGKKSTVRCLMSYELLP